MNGSQMYEKTIHIAVFVYAMFAGGRPSLCSDQLSSPSRVEDQPPRVDAREVRRPERQQHEHEQHGAGARPGDPRHEVRERERDHRVGDRDRGRDHDRPERDACGRSAPSQSVRKLSSVQLWTVSDVNGSTVQNDETNSATSAAM